MDEISNQQIDIDETISRLSSKRGVESVTVLTKEGSIIRTTMTSSEQSGLQGKLFSRLIENASDIVRQLNEEELEFMRMRTKRHEFMIALDRNYLLLIVQAPQKE